LPNPQSKITLKIYDCVYFIAVLKMYNKKQKEKVNPRRFFVQ